MITLAITQKWGMYLHPHRMLTTDLKNSDLGGELSKKARLQISETKLLASCHVSPDQQVLPSLHKPL